MRVTIDVTAKERSIHRWLQKMETFDISYISTVYAPISQ